MAYKNYRQVISSVWNATLSALNVAIKAGTAVIGKVRIVTATGDEVTNDTLDTVKVEEARYGGIYVKQMTMADDNATRFETTATKIKVAKIKVSTNTMLFGTSASQTFSLAATEQVELAKFDLSTLYFKNAGAGLNGTVDILGVTE